MTGLIWNSYDFFLYLFSNDKKIKKFNLYKKDKISVLKLYLKKNDLITVYFNKGDNFKYQIADIDIFLKKRVQILNHGETYIYYSIKKNRIGEIELKKNKKLKKRQSPISKYVKTF